MPSSVPASAGFFLIGADLPLEERKVAARAGVHVESEPLALRRWAIKKRCRFIVLDAAFPLPGEERAELIAAGVSCLFVERAKLRWFTDSLANSAQASESFKIWIYDLATVANDHQVDARPPAAPSLLTPPRSASEIGEARTRVLDAAFKERAELVANSYNTQQVAAAFCVSRQTPHDRVKAKSLLAFEERGTLWFPLFQFDPDAPHGVVAGLPDVLRSLDIGPLAQARWLQRPNAALGGRAPIQALRDGAVEEVKDEARAVGAQAGARDG
jgi:hypothetical protein